MAVTPVDSRLTSIALQQQAGEDTASQSPPEQLQSAENKQQKSFLERET
jgi:hypothetical protein